MPPKPKGLKASKRAAPVDPTTLANDTSAVKDVKLNSDRTAPLDDDALTIADLFELRTSILEILYPFPTSLTLDDADPDRLDEARSFLRGILHGCATLEPLVKTCDESSESGREAEGRVQQWADLGAEKLAALGVDHLLAEGELLFLQGFALHYLGELFEPPEQVASVARSSAAGGAKRRKVDVREPQTRVEWMAAAYSRLERLVKVVLPHYPKTTSGDERHESDALVALAYGQHWLTVARYTEEVLAAGRGSADAAADEALLDELRAVAKSLDMWSSLVDHVGYQPATSEGRYYDLDDSFLAYARAVPARLGLLEASAPGARPEAVAELDRAATRLEEYNRRRRTDDAGGPGLEEAPALTDFLTHVLAADAKAAKFLLLEDAVEAKYRPDNDDEPDDEEDEDEDEGEVEDEHEDEDEVTPLPLDAPEVVAAKLASKQAINALHGTLDLFARLDKDVAHPSAKAAQYRKLEEVLLVSSALINPDEHDKAQAMEADIETVGAESGRKADVDAAEDSHEARGAAADQ